MEDFRELKASKFPGGLVIELMGSMTYLAVQKHQSASGFALPQENVSALTKNPEGHNPQKAKQKKKQVWRVARALLAQLPRW